MRPKGLIVGTACGLALGVGVIAAVDAGTQSASAQGGFTLTTAQLKINQNISSAAVRRSNRGLNYLAPIRTAATDNADTGANGVRPLSQIPGSGDGWTSSQIGNNAITTAKVANEAINSEKIAPGGVTNGDIADNAVNGAKIDAGAVGTSKLSTEVQSQLNTVYSAAVFIPFGGEPSLTFGDGATAVARSTGLATGAFDVTFANNISQCSMVSSVGTSGQAGAVTPVFASFSTYTTLLSDTSARIFTFNNAGALADAPFAVNLVC